MISHLFAARSAFFSVRCKLKEVEANSFVVERGKILLSFVLNGKKRTIIEADLRIKMSEILKYFFPQIVILMKFSSYEKVVLHFDLETLNIFLPLEKCVKNLWHYFFSSVTTYPCHNWPRSALLHSKMIIFVQFQK